MRGRQLPPMLDQFDERYERVPNEALVDGGFVTKDAIDHAADHGCTVYAPVNDEDEAKGGGKRSPQNATAMRPPHGGSEWGPRKPKRSIACEPRRRSGLTLNAATADSGACPYGANRVVASSHCCLQLPIT